MIDESFDYADTFIEKIKADINAILKIAKIEKPRKISIFIAREKFYKNNDDYNIEFNGLKDNISNFEKAFNCKFELSKAETSKDAKANKAKAGKPAILVE